MQPVPLLGFALVVISLAGGTSGINPPLQLVEHLPRAYIHINGDDQFTPENGVVGGSGAEEDPFVISGWMILGPADWLLKLENTRMHVLVRNNLLTPAYPPDGWGGAIGLFSVTNVTIAQNDLLPAQNGIAVFDSEDIIIERNSIVGAQVGRLPSGLIVSVVGLLLVKSAVAVDGNYISGYKMGINLAGPAEAATTVSGNQLREVGYAIALTSGVSDALLHQNKIANADTGILATGASRVMIYSNELVQLKRDFDMWQAYEFPLSEIRVHNNTIVGTSWESLIFDCRYCSFTSNHWSNLAEGIGVAFAHRTVFDRNVFSESLVVIGPTTTASAMFRNNSFEPSNEVYAVANSHILDLRHNWWGSIDGPDPQKFVRKNGGDVIFSPWLDVAPDPA